MARSQPFSIRVEPEDAELFHAAAKEAGMTASEWARLVLRAAAGATELPQQLTRVVEFKARKVRDGNW